MLHARSSRRGILHPAFQELLHRSDCRFLAVCFPPSLNKFDFLGGATTPSSAKFIADVLAGHIKHE